MGRIITFDEHVQESLNSLLKKSHFETGLLVGQSTAQKDIIVHICTTPSQDESTHTDLEKEQKKSGKGSKKKLQPENDLNENWICQHAKQVTRMLPGGLDILGIFIIASQEELNRLQPNLRQVLFAIYKVLCKDQKLSVCNENTEKSILQITTVNHKYTCRTFDVSDYKSSAKPAEWKLNSRSLPWHKLDTQFSLDLRIPVDEKRNTHSLLRQIEVGLLPFFSCVSQAKALIDGKMHNEDKLLDQSTEGKKGRNLNKTSQCYTIELFLPLKLNNNSITNTEVKSCSALMTVKGTIQCRAYINSKATVKEAIQAIKHDVIRTMTSRCEIQCEDLLLIDEEQQDPQVIHELPRRVFAPLPQASLCVCDYLFHGDSARDSLDAFQELLSLNLTENDVEMTLEKTPDTLQLFQPQTIENVYSEPAICPRSSNRSLILPILSVAAAALATGISYFFFFQDVSNLK